MRTMNKGKKAAFFALHLVLWVGVLAIYIAIIMYLWNWLIPDITGWKSINYLQAFGLFVLAHTLGGNLMHGGRHHGMHRRGGRGRMHHMSRNHRREVLRHVFSSEVGNDIFSIKVETEMPKKTKSQDKNNLKEDGKE